MNIALPAFILLLFVVPGYLFLSAFYRKENTRFESKPLDVFSAQALLSALALHFIALSIVSLWFSQQESYHLLLKLVLSKPLRTAEFESLRDQLTYILGYSASVSALGYLIGKLAQLLRFRLNPYKNSRFAYNTPWYYELRGKLSPTENANLTKVSCMLESAGETFLYYGILDDFYLTPNGGLDRVVLTEVARRKITQDDPLTEDTDSSSKGETLDRFYQIKGDRLIIKNEEIQTLNIEYVYIGLKGNKAQLTTIKEKLSNLYTKCFSSACSKSHRCDKE